MAFGLALVAVQVVAACASSLGCRDGVWLQATRRHQPQLLRRLPQQWWRALAHALAGLIDSSMAHAPLDMGTAAFVTAVSDAAIGTNDAEAIEVGERLRDTLPAVVAPWQAEHGAGAAQCIFSLTAVRCKGSS